MRPKNAASITTTLLRRAFERSGGRVVPDVPWEDVTCILGTTEDVTHSGTSRPCVRCRRPTFTSRRYPDDIAVCCEICAPELARQDVRDRQTPTARRGPSRRRGTT